MHVLVLWKTGVYFSKVNSGSPAPLGILVGLNTKKRLRVRWSRDSSLWLKFAFKRVSTLSPEPLRQKNTCSSTTTVEVCVMQEVVRIMFPWSLCVRLYCVTSSSAPSLPLLGVLLAAGSPSAGAGVGLSTGGAPGGYACELSCQLM